VESACLSAGVKGPRREADHKLPFTAEIKNDWNYTDTPTSVFIACTEKTSLYMGDYSPDSSLFSPSFNSLTVHPLKEAQIKH